MNKEVNINEYLEKTKFGAAVEVAEMMIADGYSKVEAERVLELELATNGEEYNNADDFHSANHKTYGYSGRLNQALNSIREIIRTDIIKIMETGHKAQILALREDLLQYVSVIDGFQDETVEGGSE